MSNDKDNINDLLHTAKELEKWQEKDEPKEMPIPSHKDRIMRSYERDQYDRYSRHEMCH